jgi:hypothetical protein
MVALVDHRDVFAEDHDLVRELLSSAACGNSDLSVRKG